MISVVVRRVRIARKIRPKQRGTLWAYGYPELAALAGKSEGAVRLDVLRGQLDPSDLGNVFAWMTRCRARRARRGRA